MSLKMIVPITFILTFAVIVGHSRFQQRSDKGSISSFASVNQSSYSNRGIVDRIIQVQLVAKQIGEDSQEISAEINLPFNYDGDLEFKWTLAENVTLVSEELIGIISGYKKGYPSKIKLIVNGFTKNQSRFVSLEVTGKKNSRRIFGESLLASQADQSFEKIVQNVERIKAERNGKSSD